VTYDLVLFDIATRTASRLTSAPGSDFAPAWSPDGRRIAYSVADQDLIAVVVVDPPGEPQTLAEGSAPRWLPEGNSLLFQRLADGASWDIWRYGLEDDSETLLLDSPANERWPAPSPDGRWLAYTSDETGREELFVRGLPEGDKVQVSGRGATEPRWASPDELLFRSGTGLHTARRRPGEPLAFEQPELLLSLTDAGLSSGEGLYAPGPDGTLVVFRDVIREDAAVLTLVTNWFLEFEDDR